MLQIYAFTMGSFASEICRDFSPGFGLPLYYFVGVGIVPEPGFGPGNEFKKRGILLASFQFGIAVFFTDPAHGRSRVGIDQAITFMLLEEGKAVYYGQELTNIIRSFLKRPISGIQLPTPPDWIATIS